MPPRSGPVTCSRFTPVSWKRLSRGNRAVQASGRFSSTAAKQGITGDDIFLIARGFHAGDDPPIAAIKLGRLQVQRSGSVFTGAQIRRFRRMAGYPLCHWGPFRRAGLHYGDAATGRWPDRRRTR
jgi:hypothetical protein